MTVRVEGAPKLFSTTWSPTVVGFPRALLDMNVSLHFSASNALWNGIRQLDLKAGDTVLFPAYHCGAELDVCLKAGLDVAFYDVEPSLAIDWDGVKRLVDSKTRALFVIHYFGFPLDLEPARTICDEYGLILIEDCAHALYSRNQRNQLCGRVGTMAVFSLRKFLPVPEGGALWLAGPVVSMPNSTPPPANETFRMLRLEGQRSLRAHGVPLPKRMLARAVLLSGLPFSFYCKVKGNKLPPRANDPSLEFSQMGSNWGMSTIARWITEHTDHEMVVHQRRTNYVELVGCLASCSDVQIFFPQLPEGVCPWLCPIITDDCESLVTHLRRRGIEAAPLWREAHPRWSSERFPQAKRLKDHAVALPIHQDLGVQDMRTMANEVHKWNASA